MNATEAIDKLIETDSSRSYFAQKEVRAHRPPSGVSHNRTTIYSVSVVPGIGGQKCSLFYAASFEEAVGNAIHRLSMPTFTPTPNDE